MTLTGRSDASLLNTFRKQCLSPVGPRLALLAWKGQAGVEQDDLIDIAREVMRNPRAEGS